MPQEFHVVQCYSCHTFQVQQVKKTTKWACKMCGEKQSLKKVYGRGSGAECRQHVQRLNSLRAEIDHSACSDHSNAEDVSVASEGYQMHIATVNRWSSSLPDKTKWNAFVEGSHFENNRDDNSGDNDDNDDDLYTTDAIKFKHGRKRKRQSKGGNFIRTGNTKWSEFSASDPEDCKNCCNSYQGKSSHKPPVTDVYSSELMFKGPKDKSGLHFEESSQWRKSEGITETNLPSTQDSYCKGYDENCTKRIKTDSYTPGNVYDMKQGGYLSKGHNSKKNTKWKTFVEVSDSSNYCQQNYSDGLDEASCDSRPYMIYNPTKIDKPSDAIPFHEENENFTEHCDRNAKDNGYNEERNGLNSCMTRHSYSLSKNCNSKWSSFLDSQETVNHSEQVLNQSAVCEVLNQSRENLYQSSLYTNGTGRQTTDNEKYPDSKWAMYQSTSEDMNNGRTKMEEKSYVAVSITEQRSPLHENILKDRPSNPICFDRSRFLENSGYQLTGKSSKGSENVKPLFTAGDLDDTDFEL